MKKRTFAKELEELIEIFIAENYKKPSSIRQQKSRLRRCVGIFQEHGITSPTVEDFEILRAEIKSDAKKYISLARDFYNWLEMRGDNKMKENESTAQQGIIDVEQVEQQQAAPSIMTFNNEDNSEPKRGRPQKAGREEKFTLYMTKERMNNLKALSEGYNISITDILNNLIDEYCEKKNRYLQMLLRQKQEREAFLSEENTAEY